MKLHINNLFEYIANNDIINKSYGFESYLKNAAIPINIKANYLNSLSNYQFNDHWKFIKECLK